MNKIVLTCVVLLSLFYPFTGCTQTSMPKIEVAINAYTISEKNLQLLLDNIEVMNFSYPRLPEMLSGNIYAADKNINKHQLAKEDYKACYLAIKYANTVLDYLAQADLQADSIRGAAHFFRGCAFYNAAQLFCLPYQRSAFHKPGIILPLSKGDTPARATVMQTYIQIIADLKIAAALLSANKTLPTTPTRPTAAAAYAMLSRVYLSMRNYRQAECYADSCLSMPDVTLDYVRLPYRDEGTRIEFSWEVIFLAGAAALQDYRVDPDLYRTYRAQDMRRKVLFVQHPDGTVSFRGQSDLTPLRQYSYFTGIATDEVYLTRAECRIRNGKVKAGINDLNKLLINRNETEGFVPVDPGITVKAALQLVLSERRKSLIGRGIHWTDIRRLNGQAYRLLPRDRPYVLQIPE